jgi:hypothetical protein
MFKTSWQSTLLCKLLLAGCGGGDRSAIVSGEMRSAGASPNLSSRQVAALNAWLSEHRAGWGLVHATPPTPDLVIVVKRQSGRSGSLSFYSQEGWKGALTYLGSDPKDSEQGGIPAEQVRALRNDLMESQ